MRAALLGIALSQGPGAAAQGRPDSAALLAAQVEAMAQLKAMNGNWRGTAWTLLPSGERLQLTQTERIGPLLGGTLKLVEGRGHDAEGKLVFNAFGVVSFDPATGSFAMRSYAQGRAGDFVLKPTHNGYTWEIPAGPATIRYTAVIENGRFNEIGERILPGRDPLRIFEMNLTRLSDSAWPAEGAIGPK